MDAAFAAPVECYPTRRGFQRVRRAVGEAPPSTSTSWRHAPVPDRLRRALSRTEVYLAGLIALLCLVWTLLFTTGGSHHCMTVLFQRYFRRLRWSAALPARAGATTPTRPAQTHSSRRTPPSRSPGSTPSLPSPSRFFVDPDRTGVAGAGEQRRRGHPPSSWREKNLRPETTRHRRSRLRHCGTATRKTVFRPAHEP
jgi:hypothetical protein